ncbi:class I SAM-dependent methyltransferase [Maribellus sp. YY47]|uniref:class I SAM-dependent methyltransferase n=1 Tax=Maribellus sp. YY47 TaxID=2929486 RepID=UPI0020011EF2|nr:class I SAM-dependent methyltransferase [Maribellus sp. YY47]MCK3684426.1 class I SAM-dependent methyltransferase [Maribellus sp. YY47]
MSNFWDERYSSEEYAYGEKPNEFYQQEISKLAPGTILFAAEGEGRNAVYAATLGWKVDAFDSSREAKEKAILLAKKNNVQINYRVESYDEVLFEPESFDCIVLIYAHMHLKDRERNHKLLTSFLKPGGTLILEGFRKEQINLNSGGPKNEEMLFSKEEMKNDFRTFSSITIEETDINLNEGPFHQGRASVIRVVGKK